MFLGKRSLMKRLLLLISVRPTSESKVKVAMLREKMDQTVFGRKLMPTSHFNQIKYVIQSVPKSDNTVYRAILRRAGIAMASCPPIRPSVRLRILEK